ncbi:MAG TPA: (2Fe-2S)-binding protein [Thermoplasmata archaeon]|nr:(2Fe-2S)-binding protein [Thermoplasmata archaeon]HYB77785.1 (2Fe-2S)-binding protein [Thermoplasmata archaeon]
MTNRPLSLTVNGKVRPLDGVPESERLLDTIRWRLGLRGTKEGCRSGECGACTVLVDGVSTLSCLTLSHEVDGSSLTTIEGMADDPVGHEVEEAFARAGALQCGYCTPGFVIALVGLLNERGRSASVDELLADLGGNLCRCTGYLSIARAVALLQKEGR